MIALTFILENEWSHTLSAFLLALSAKLALLSAKFLILSAISAHTPYLSLKQPGLSLAEVSKLPFFRTLKFDLCLKMSGPTHYLPFY
jgi:hypothetical protein